MSRAQAAAQPASTLGFDENGTVVELDDDDDGEEINHISQQVL